MQRLRPTNQRVKKYLSDSEQTSQSLSLHSWPHNQGCSGGHTAGGIATMAGRKMPGLRLDIPPQMARANSFSLREDASGIVTKSLKKILVFRTSEIVCPDPLDQEGPLDDEKHDLLRSPSGSRSFDKIHALPCRNPISTLAPKYACTLTHRCITMKKSCLLAFTLFLDLQVRHPTHSRRRNRTGHQKHLQYLGKAKWQDSSVPTFC